MTFSMKDKAKEYFRLFSEKDLNGLSDVFDDEATLRDQNIEAEGKANVFLAMKAIFDAVESINVEPTNIWQEPETPETVIAELEITTNEEKIQVVDIIDFTNEGKVKSIRAFKG